MNEAEKMRILGARVRAYRKARGLSQKDLAKNICTQATISLIEKRNKIPSMQILLKLCSRLGIQLNDVIVETDDQAVQIFREVGYAVRTAQYRNAESRLDRVKLRSLKENDEIKAYYYYRGQLQLMNHDNPDEAIFNFGMLLNEFNNRSKDIYSLMSRLGLGLAYAKKGEFDKAELFVNQAVRDLDEFDSDSHDLVQDQVSSYLQAAKFFQEIGKDGRTLSLAKKAIKLSEQNNSLFLLEDIYQTMALSQLKLDDGKNAQQNMYIAYALALVSKNQRLAESITSNVAKYQIPPLAL
ncbi:helix-turn-helix domain-containing protein [Lactobacillus rossiae]|uniref:Helix-turn-helix domain-containing protein n=2 Tax=Furfurilactobacillus milii TaxID=2888272 RepID=A0A6N9I495_9LACO|nr:helix-turn-helix domain-containing protein [Furfurilactobacillus milii]